MQVYLDGKTAEGKTIYKNPDMSEHIHKLKGQDQQQQTQTQPVQSSTTIVTENTAHKIINARLDRVIELLETNNQLITTLIETLPQQKQQHSKTAGEE